jgi:hypothetical protein
MSDHVKEMKPKLKNIQEQLKKMTSENHPEQLLQLIHKPGFTTPQEVLLIHAMLDSVTHQLEGLLNAQNALLAACEQIGQAKAA